MPIIHTCQACRFRYIVANSDAADYASFCSATCEPESTPVIETAPALVAFPADVRWMVSAYGD